jgi:carbohydrate binding protein with CBM6 domain
VDLHVERTHPPGRAAIATRVAGAAFTVRADSPTGPVVARVTGPHTGSTSILDRRYRWFTARVTDPGGVHDLYFVTEWAEGIQPEVFVRTVQFSETGVCRGTLGVRTVGNLRVPSGATCRLQGTQVQGNVQADRAQDVSIEASTHVRGNVEVERGGSVTLSGARVDGNVQLTRNRGGVAVSNNTIGGNLQCKGNEPPPTGGGNTVGGNKEGQCGGL